MSALGASGPGPWGHGPHDLLPAPRPSSPDLCPAFKVQKQGIPIIARTLARCPSGTLHTLSLLPEGPSSPGPLSGHWLILPNRCLGTAPAPQPRNGGQGGPSNPDTAGRGAFQPPPTVGPVGGDACALAAPPPQPCALQRPHAWHAGWGCCGRTASDLACSGGHGHRRQRARPPWCSRLPASPARGHPPRLGAPHATAPRTTGWLCP